MERLFHSSGIGFVVVAPDQSILDANQTFCTKLGYSLDELRNMHVLDYTHPEDKVVTSNLFQHLKESNLVQVFEKRYITKSGDTFWCKLRSEAVHDDTGAVRFRIVMVEDITRAKLDEINLEQMAAITEASDDAIFRCDVNGIIEFWGKGAERMYGYTAQEAIGENAIFIAAEPGDAGMERAHTKLSRGEVVIDPDAMARRKDGSLIEISALIFPIRNKEGRTVAFAAVHRDITAFKQLEIQFQHSQRLETAGLLAGGIAHDFNNIITVIQGASNLLAQDFSEGSYIATHLNLIERSAERATRLTRQLLAFSRKQKVSPVIIDPNMLIEDSVNIINRTLGDDIQLQTSLNSTWCIREDATRLEQVMLNLAVNARHAMPKGGILSIHTRDIEITHAQATTPQASLSYSPSVLQEGTYVLVTVADTGCGMDKATLEKIFDPFFTTKPKGEGTGLGLSVVYGMVTQVGGSITVCTEQDVGTQFYIYLPRVDGEASYLAPAVETRLEKHKGRILVLEDDDGVRTLATALLEDAGYTVFQAPHPRAVLEGTVETDVDLILSDVMMPGMTGPEFSEIWLKSHPSTKFLFMSGYFDEATFAEKLSNKILIQKPFKPMALIETVASIIADRQD